MLAVINLFLKICAGNFSATVHVRVILHMQNESKWLTCTV